MTGTLELLNGLNPHPVEVFRYSREMRFGPSLPSVFESELRYWLRRHQLPEGTLVHNWFVYWAAAAIYTENFHSQGWKGGYSINNEDQYPTSRISAAHFYDGIIKGQIDIVDDHLLGFVGEFCQWLERHRDNNIGEEDLPKPTPPAPAPAPVPQQPKPTNPEPRKPVFDKRLLNMLVYIWAAVAWFLPLPGPLEQIITEILKAIASMFGG